MLVTFGVKRVDIGASDKLQHNIMLLLRVDNYHYIVKLFNMLKLHAIFQSAIKIVIHGKTHLGVTSIVVCINTKKSYGTWNTQGLHTLQAYIMLQACATQACFGAVVIYNYIGWSQIWIPFIWFLHIWWTCNTLSSSWSAIA